MGCESAPKDRIQLPPQRIAGMTPCPAQIQRQFRECFPGLQAAREAKNSTSCAWLKPLRKISVFQ